jgi:UDP-N-acetyl-D-mannosaminuronic acid dehydrogenase
VQSVVDAVATTTDPVVACLGLAFKANIDDLRESPALEITEQLARRLPGATVLAVEPHVRALPPALEGLDNVVLSEATDAIAKADVVVLLVDHAAFKRIAPADLAGKATIDTRGIWR